MVVFSGKALGKAFASVEAKDPFDLCHQLLPSSEPSKDYRMWIEVSSSSGNKFWCDVCLIIESSHFFKVALGMHDGAGDLNTVIRGAKEPSPYSRPEEKSREEQLKELKEMELYARVRYWIADMFQFEEAATRLGYPTTTAASDASKLMSPYYFSKRETRYLGNLLVPGLIPLNSFLNKFSTEKENVCASHNLAAKMMCVFDIEKNFHEDGSFQKEREEWIKARNNICGDNPETLIVSNSHQRGML